MLKKKKDYTVAIVGATGAVGREMIQVLEERKFPIKDCRLLASERTAGEQMSFRGKDHTVQELGPKAFEGVDLALFSAGEAISREYAPKAVSSGAVTIDNSAEWRMNPDVPLVVPEVNPKALQSHRGIIANPNCSTIQLVVVLKPLHDAATLKRIVVSTYQSVSGTGKEAMDELMDQTKAIMAFREVSCKIYPHQIAFNLLPSIGSFRDDGYSTEEIKLDLETRKIMGNDHLRITATTVRVPVFRAHSESVNIETEKKLTAHEARALLAAAPGITLYDDPQHKLYPMPLDVAGTDKIYVGRIREDFTVASGLNLWIVADNLRKGAALNTVQIAEELIRQ